MSVCRFEICRRCKRSEYRKLHGDPRAKLYCDHIDRQDVFYPDCFCRQNWKDALKPCLLRSEIARLERMYHSKRQRM